MGFYKQFESFDPILGDVPSHPIDYLPEVTARARALLKSRTAEQITSAARSIDWIISDYFCAAKENEIERLKRVAQGDGSDRRDAVKFFQKKGKANSGAWIFDLRREHELEMPSLDNTTEVAALKQCIDGWKDIGGDNFSGGKPQELFAVLSLWLLADASLGLISSEASG